MARKARGGEQLEIPETIDPALKARHAELLQHFRHGIAESAIAAAAIKGEKTYVTDGYASFVDFMADELDTMKTTAYALVGAGPVFQILESDDRHRPILEAITSIEQLKPISKMPAERQVQVLQLAVEKSGKTRAGRPKLSGEFVAEVAEQHFNWTRDKNRSRQRSHDEKPEGLKNLERHFKGIAECGVTPELAIESYGDPGEWDYFENATEWLRQVKRLAES